MLFFKHCNLPNHTFDTFKCVIVIIDQVCFKSVSAKQQLSLIGSTASLWLSGWILGPEKFPSNKKKNPVPWLLGSWNCKKLLVKSLYQ